MGSERQVGSSRHPAEHDRAFPEAGVF